MRRDEKSSFSLTHNFSADFLFICPLNHISWKQLHLDLLLIQAKASLNLGEIFSTEQMKGSHTEK